MKGRRRDVLGVLEILFPWEMGWSLAPLDQRRLSLELILAALPGQKVSSSRSWF
jgi:hypothetical protein